MSPVLGIIASSTQQGRGGGPVGAYDALATVTVPSGGLSTITFTSIPLGYEHLQIRAIGQGVNAGGRDILFQFNGDTGSNYNSHQLYGNGSSVVGQAKGTSTNGWFTYWDSTQFGSCVFDVLDYSNNTKNKTTRSLGGHDLNGSGFVLMRSGLWLNTAPITSISFFTDSGNFSQYTQFALYGVK